MTRLKHISTCLVVAISAVAMTGCVTDDEPEVITFVNPGDKLPQFTVELNNGDELTTNDLAGAPSVIVLFSTECPDCRRELPVIQKLHEKRPDLKIICISRENPEEAVSGFWLQEGLTLTYSAQQSRNVYSLFASSGIPRTYISDSSLTVRYMFGDNERMTVDKLEEAIESLQ